MTINFQHLVDENEGKVAHYAWPGYQIIYYCKDGGCLCPKCVEDNLELILVSIEEGYDDQWIIEVWDCLASCLIEDYGHIQCDHCYEQFTFENDEEFEAYTNNKEQK